MAKNKIFRLFVLGITFFLSAIGSNAGQLDVGQFGARQKVKEVYTSQIGVRELTGRNDGDQVERYLAVTALKRGNPWCAAFIAWTFKQAKVDAITSAYSPSWFPQKRIVYQRSRNSITYIPATGDVFGIYFNNLKRIAHVGFVDLWQSNYCITVEGNTNGAGSREGDGVYRKRRLINQIYKVSNWIGNV